jgi:hypothetical protein
VEAATTLSFTLATIAALITVTALAVVSEEMAEVVEEANRLHSKSFLKEISKMKENLMFAWIASWFALVGQLVLFIGVALYTGDWRYVMWSFMVSMLAGVPSMINTRRAQQKANMKTAGEI